MFSNNAYLNSLISVKLNDAGRHWKYEDSKSEAQRWKMNPLLVKALLRTAFFIAWTCFSAWLFVQVEYTENDFVDEKYQLLRSLYISMVSKYNMTIDDFNKFSNIAHEALSAPDLQWTYDHSFDFVYQTVTTIGEDSLHQKRKLKCNV